MAVADQPRPNAMLRGLVRLIGRGMRTNQVRDLVLNPKQLAGLQR